MSESQGPETLLGRARQRLMRAIGVRATPSAELVVPRSSSVPATLEQDVAEFFWTRQAAKGLLPAMDYDPQTADLRRVLEVTLTFMLEKARELNGMAQHRLPENVIREVLEVNAEKRIVQHAVTYREQGDSLSLPRRGFQNGAAYLVNPDTALMAAASDLLRNQELGAKIMLGSASGTFRRQLVERAETLGINLMLHRDAIPEVKMTRVLRGVEENGEEFGNPYAIVAMKTHFATLGSGQRLVARTVWAIELPESDENLTEEELSLMHSVRLYADHLNELGGQELDQFPQLKADLGMQMAQHARKATFAHPVVESVFAFRPDNDPHAKARRSILRDELIAGLHQSDV